MVTVLLPVYNDEKYLRYTLESLLVQSYEDFVCLMGFNGTVDRSREITKEIVGTDSRFRISDYGQDKGKSITLNKLLSLVETDHISLIDGDDIWEPNKLSEQIVLTSQYDVVGTLASYINESNQIVNPCLFLTENDRDIKEGFKRGHNQIVNSSALLKTEHAREIGGWDSSFEGLEDFDFWLRLAKSKRTFHNIQKVLVHHRVHSESNFNARVLQYGTKDLLIKNQINLSTILC